MKIQIESDKIRVTFDKKGTIQTKAIRIYDIKTIVIETIDVVIDCFSEDKSLTGSIYYKLDGNLNVEYEDNDFTENIPLIEDGHISEDIFKWNGSD